MLFFIPLLFGPSVYYYTKTTLGYKVKNTILFSLIPGICSFLYGINILFSETSIKITVLSKIIAGEHLLFNVLNLFALICILIYSIKSWLFLKTTNLNKNDIQYDQYKLKKSWLKEFIIYIFTPVFLFTIFHSLVIAEVINISLMVMDLIWMPVFMLLVYLLLSIRSQLMFKEFEYQSLFCVG